VLAMDSLLGAQFHLSFAANIKTNTVGRHHVVMKDANGFCGEVLQAQCRQSPLR
jgi:hypothetical protein